MPTPSLVIMALVWAGTLNSSAANLRTAVNGACSGTEKTLYGNLGSDVSTTLNVTLDEVAGCALCSGKWEGSWSQRFGSD